MFPNMASDGSGVGVVSTSRRVADDKTDRFPLVEIVGRPDVGDSSIKAERENCRSMLKNFRSCLLRILVTFPLLCMIKTSTASVDLRQLVVFLVDFTRKLRLCFTLSDIE